MTVAANRITNPVSPPTTMFRPALRRIATIPIPIPTARRPLRDPWRRPHPGASVRARTSAALMLLVDCPWAFSCSVNPDSRWVDAMLLQGDIVAIDATSVVPSVPCALRRPWGNAAPVSKVPSDEPRASHRPRRPAPRTCPAPRVRRHRANHLRAGDRARSPRPRHHHVRQRRFGRPGSPHPDGGAGAPSRGIHGRADALHARDDAIGPRPRDRVRPDPLAPRMGQPDAGARVAGPGRLDLPRPPRPALCGRGLEGSAAGPRRDQRQPGVDPPGRALDGRSTTA